jgi:hypothetical protein
VTVSKDETSVTGALRELKLAQPSLLSASTSASDSDSDSDSDLDDGTHETFQITARPATKRHDRARHARRRRRRPLGSCNAGSHAQRGPGAEVRRARARFVLMREDTVV